MRTTITILAAMLVACAAGCAHNGKQAYSPDEYFQQGLANESAGNTSRAMMHYGQAIDADPMHAASLYHLAVLETNACDYDRAIPTWRQYIHATHNSGEAWSNLGWTYEKMGWPRNAEGAYRSGLIADAKSTACQTNLGLFLARHNQPAEALTHLQCAMTPAQAHADLAMIYREQGLNDKADLELAKAKEIDPSTVATMDENDQDETPVATEDESAFFKDVQNTDQDDMQDEAQVDPQDAAPADAQAEQPAHEEQQQATEAAPSNDDAQTQIDETDLLINPDPH
jgi:tetratricopeptide (TPR) repeat protein